MTRAAIALATALLFALPASAADRSGGHGDAPAAKQTTVAKPAKPKEPKKRKPIKGETSDYLVVTLVDASVVN